MKIFVAVCFLFAVSTSAYVVKSRDEHLQFRNECIAELKVPTDLLNQYKQFQYPNDSTTQCYLKCIFVKFGFFDTTNGFSVENIHQQLVGVAAEANHGDDLHTKISSCIDKNEQGSNACEWVYRGATCLIKNNLPLVQRSVATQT